MTRQNNQVHCLVYAIGGSPEARVRDFIRMNPYEFLWSLTTDDPNNFINDIKMIF